MRTRVNRASGKTLLTVGLVWACAALSLLSCAGSEGAGRIHLAGEWRLVVEKGPPGGVPDFNAPEALTIRLPGEWSSIMCGESRCASTVWLKKKVFIPKGWSSGIAVLNLGRIAVADECFFNGVMIGREGSWPAPGEGNLDYGFAWQKLRRYYVPMTLLKEGEENEITLRVFSHVLCGISGELVIESGSDRGISSSLPGMLPDMLNAAGFVLNIVLVVLFIIAIDWRSRKWEVIYVSLLLAIVSLVHLIILGLHFSDGLWRYKSIFIMVLWGHFVFLLAVEKFLNLRYRYVNVACGVLLAVDTVLIALSTSGKMLMDVTGFFTMIVVLAYILYYTSVFVLAMYRDPLRYWPFLVAAIPLVISSAVLSGYVFLGKVYSMPSSITLHLPMALMAVLIVFILDFRSIKKENNSLARSLLKTNWKYNELKKHLARDRGKDEPREKIYQVIEYLDSNYMEAYERKNLAVKFGLNEDYMVQIFKKTTGSTISKYINAKRIDAAKQLLRDTDTKIIDIAYHVGFDNLTHFHRQFKEQAGMTPKEYRESRRIIPESDSIAES